MSMITSSGSNAVLLPVYSAQSSWYTNIELQGRPSHPAFTFVSQDYSVRSKSSKEIIHRSEMHNRFSP